MLKNRNFVAGYPDAAAVGATPTPLGKSIANNNAVFWFQPIGGTTLGPFLGGSLSGTSTVSTAVTPGTGTNISRWRRSLSTGAAAISTSAGLYTSYTRWTRGATSGFDATMHFAIEANVDGHGAFAGFSQNIGAISSSQPSTFLNMIGVGFDDTDLASGTWFIMSNDATGPANKIAIPAMTRNTTESYIMRITCPQGAASNITISVTNATTGAVVLAPTVVSTRLPVANTTMAIGAHMRTNAVATTAPVVSVMSIYINAND